MYLDPGFGGMLLQVIVVIIATGGAILFSLRKKIIALFIKENKEDIVNPPDKINDSDSNIIDLLSDEDINDK